MSRNEIVKFLQEQLYYKIPDPALYMQALTAITAVWTDDVYQQVQKAENPEPSDV